MTTAAPIQTRNTSIDTLRGFALLGILVMNISSFAMPDAAYINPEVYGGDGLVDRTVHALSHVLFDQKFMGLFSMLFGAGVILLTDRLGATDRSPGLVHYLRTLWLLAFGVAHSFLIWEGDILMIYALCSLVLYWFRELRPAILLGLGVAVMVSIVVAHLAGVAAVTALGEGVSAGTYLTPSSTEIATEIGVFRDGSYLEQVAYRLNAGVSEELDAATSIFVGTFAYDGLARAFGMMLIGMALYRWGVLSGERSPAFYRRLAVVGFGAGVPLAALGLWARYAADWDPVFVMGWGSIPNLVATAPMSAGYAALVMLWCRRGGARALRGRLAAVGQTALTNYIAQSVIATTVFYGLDLFGELGRAAQLLVMAAIWGIQLVSSPWWLARFRFGPLEWLWRTLTYLRFQPMLRQAPA